MGGEIGREPPLTQRWCVRATFQEEFEQGLHVPAEREQVATCADSTRGAQHGNREMRPTDRRVKK